MRLVILTKARTKGNKPKHYRAVKNPVEATKLKNGKRYVKTDKGWRLAKSDSPGRRLVLLIKTRLGEERQGHKYLRRWKGKDGKWVYLYAEKKGSEAVPSKEISPLQKRADAVLDKCGIICKDEKALRYMERVGKDFNFEITPEDLGIKYKQKGLHSYMHMILSDASRDCRETTPRGRAWLVRSVVGDWTDLSFLKDYFPKDGYEYEKKIIAEFIPDVKERMSKARDLYIEHVRLGQNLDEVKMSVSGSDLAVYRFIRRGVSSQTQDDGEDKLVEESAAKINAVVATDLIKFGIRYEDDPNRFFSKVEDVIPQLLEEANFLDFFKGFKRVTDLDEAKQVAREYILSHWIPLWQGRMQLADLKKKMTDMSRQIENLVGEMPSTLADIHSGKWVDKLPVFDRDIIDKLALIISLNHHFPHISIPWGALEGDVLGKVLKGESEYYQEHNLDPEHAEAAKELLKRYEKFRKNIVEKASSLVSASSEEVSLVRKSMEDSFDREAHGNFGFRIRGVYKIISGKLEKDFSVFKEEKNHVIKAFHGTEYKRAFGIAREGFKIKGVRTGRLLGDGIYGTPVSSKSLQYVGEQGFTREKGSRGVLLVCEAALGDVREMYPGASEYVGKGQIEDTCYAKKGSMGGLKNEEFCCKHPWQIIPRYWVDVEITDAGTYAYEEEVYND